MAVDRPATDRLRPRTTRGKVVQGTADMRNQTDDDESMDQDAPPSSDHGTPASSVCQEINSDGAAFSSAPRKPKPPTALSKKRAKAFAHYDKELQVAIAALEEVQSELSAEAGRRLTDDLEELGLAVDDGNEVPWELLLDDEDDCYEHDDGGFFSGLGSVALKRPRQKCAPVLTPVSEGSGSSSSSSSRSKPDVASLLSQMQPPSCAGAAADSCVPARCHKNKKQTASSSGRATKKRKKGTTKSSRDLDDIDLGLDLVHDDAED
eukprot:g20415.t1